MGKVAKKLVVYFDQNFLSNMAKADDNERVNPKFTHIYELLHRGFVDEKLVVPASFFHDLETALAPRLRENIQSYQGYLGQIGLRLRNQVQSFEVQAALDAFNGQGPEETTYTIAFNDDPDQRTQQFKISANIDYGQFGWRADRERTADSLEQTRKRIRKSGVTFDQQLTLELDAHRDHILEIHPWLRTRFTADPARLAEFCRSDHFAQVPSIDLFVRMWAKLLTGYPDRRITPSDCTDIEIISAYLPYVDAFLRDPRAIVPGTSMKDFALWDEEVRSLNAYLMTLVDQR